MEAQELMAFDLTQAIMRFFRGKPNSEFFTVGSVIIRPDNQDAIPFFEKPSGNMICQWHIDDTGRVELWYVLGADLPSDSSRFMVIGVLDCASPAFFDKLDRFVAILNTPWDRFERLKQLILEFAARATEAQ